MTCDLHQFRCILVCLRYGIGDVVMELPVLEALCRAAPDARLCAIGARPAVDVLAMANWSGDVRAVDEFGLTHWGDEGNGKTEETLREWLEDFAPDLALDPLHQAKGLRHALYERGCSIREAHPGAIREALEEEAGAVEAIRRGAISGWGLPVPEGVQPHLAVSAAQRESVRRRLADIGCNGRYAVLSPVASLHLKRWPAERLARVAEECAAEGLLVVLADAPGGEEAKAVHQLVRPEFRQRTFVVQAPQIAQLTALLAEAEAVICNDTGVLHLAAAAGTPSTGIFGPTSRAVFQPREYDGAGGENDECPHFSRQRIGPPGCWQDDRCLVGNESCINQVQVSDVLEAMRANMQRGRRGVATAT